MILQYSCKDTPKTTFETKLQEQLQGLVEASTTDLERLSPIKWNTNTQPAFYTQDGAEISNADYFKLIQNHTHKAVYFLNEEDQVKAVVAMPMDPKDVARTKRANSARVKVGEKAKSLGTKDIYGSAIDFAALKGKVVVLNFWFINCPPCKKEIPSLNSLTEEYQDKDVVFIAVSRDSKKRILEFFETYPFRYQHVSSRNVIRNYGIRSFPTHVVIDQQGIIRWLKVGGGDTIDRELQQEIDKLL